MQIPFLNNLSRILPSQLQVPLEKLAGNHNLSDAQKVGEVARQFEALLMRQILGQANKPAGTGSGVASSIYNDMVNTQLADSISHSGGMGLAKALQGQLTHQVLHNKAEAASKIIPHPNPNATNSN